MSVKMKKINLGQKEVIHFVGIGGIGMSGLAQVMKVMGFNVQGSDLNFNKSYQSISHFYPEGTIVSNGLSKWC